MYRPNKNLFKLLIIISCLFLCLILTSNAASIAATASEDQTAVKTQFKDITENDPLLPFIRYLTEKGIINGFPDGTFQPGANVTRSQAAKAVVLAKGLQPLKNVYPSFKDVNSKHWVFGEIEAAAQAGFFKGYPDGAFRPDKKISRAEAVSLFIRLTGGTLAENDITIKDVAPGNWAYWIVATVVQAGLVKPGEDQLFHPDWPADFSLGQYAFRGAIYDGQNIWMVPCFADRVVKIDKDTGVMTGYGSWPDSLNRNDWSFQGGVFDGQNVWLIPCGADIAELTIGLWLRIS
ncbi:MAG TPA: hypothetical protein DCK76_12250 [Desulfotomaculum sp.]|nr:MAG: putative membrane protein [Desulfotomaculum sp. 46_80]HAG12107.1 hypothetical protein [Desulfotomaculum sp.]HBY04928.1 hypothetical protein [Desulfotomaculum sp.]